MSTHLTPEQILDNAIAFGRAHVRIIESAEYLLTRSPSLVEGVILRLALTISSLTIPPFLLILSADWCHTP